jgi:SNF2 family DNA or RNA helicase
MSYEFKSKPFAHQLAEFERSREEPARALFWEQGTGKTKPMIDTAAWLFEQGKIDAVIVIAPSGVHRNWLTDEIPAHLPERVARRSKSHMWDTRRAGNVGAKREQEELIKHKGLAWLFMNYDAVMTDKGKTFLWRMLRARRSLYILDEGHYIKTPGAQRTKRLVASGRYAPYRRLLTGTPIATGPFDIYTQVRFLMEDFWERLRLGSFRVFKFRYGEWYTRAESAADTGYDPGYDRLIDYKNLDDLKRHVDTVGSRVTKDDVLPDLPPKLYTRRYFTLTPEQTRIYTQLRDEYASETESGQLIDAELAIVRLLRLQQIVSGYIGVDNQEEPIELIPGKNPLLDEVEEMCTSIHRPGIIWCRFTKTIDLLMHRLGKSAVRYDGTLDEDEAERSKLAFQAGDAQWFIGNSQKGATGLTLVQAKFVLYPENSFRYVDRVQSEDRAHRIGQTDPVSYTDFEARLPDGTQTISRHIINNLRGKMDIASQITGDQLRNWL